MVAAASVTYAVTLRRVIRADAAQLEPAPAATADAIVVLGGHVYPDAPCRELAMRLDHGRALWEAGAAPLLVMTGGIDGELDETEEMARYLRTHGVPETAIDTVKPSHNTRVTIESLAQRPGHYLLVSSRYHAHRLAVTARRYGVDAVVDCVPHSPDVDIAQIHRNQLHTETIASILYALPPGIANPARRLVGRLRYEIPGWLNRRAGLEHRA